MPQKRIAGMAIRSGNGCSMTLFMTQLLSRLLHAQTVKFQHCFWENTDPLSRWKIISKYWQSIVLKSMRLRGSSYSFYQKNENHKTRRNPPVIRNSYTYLTRRVYLFINRLWKSHKILTFSSFSPLYLA